MDEQTLKRKEGEHFLAYLDRLLNIRNNKEVDIDKSEIYEMVFEKRLSPTESRKRIYLWEDIKEQLTKEGIELSDFISVISKHLKTDKELEVLKHEYENYEQIKSYKETTEINKDGTYTSDRLIGIENEDKLKDEDFLLEIHGYNKNKWEIVSARNSIWNTQLKGGKITKLYASKINVKPKKDNISIDEIKQCLSNLGEKYNKVCKDYKPLVKDGLMLEVPICDLHLGKLSFDMETNEEVNTEILEQRFMSVIYDFTNRVKNQNIEKIIFQVGQDFFNSDTIDNTTTKGTRQDNDLRWNLLFLKGVELLIKGIDVLSEVAPVEVFYVAGNHDKMSSYHALVALNGWYRNDNRVNVNLDPKTRKYIEFGKCLIGFSHGETEKGRIEDIMQVEAKEMWGRTVHHEWHLGHLHSEMVKCKSGLILRRLPTVTGTDAWHYESGYVGNIKKAQAFLWHKEYGLIDNMYSVIV